MSYGYMIASMTPIPELQKHRRFKFSMTQFSNLYIYSRLEETNSLTIRKSKISIITKTGEDFFSVIRGSFFLMDFLLLKNQSEAEVAKIFISDKKSPNFDLLMIKSGATILINHPYKAYHE